MADYIEKEAAKEAILSWAVCINHPELLSKEDAMHCINKLPAADVAPVRHGTWKLKMVGAFGDLKQYSCSECGFSLLLNPTKIPPYCEDCGTKMDKEK